MVATFSENLGWWLFLFRRKAFIYSRDDVPVAESAMLGRTVFFEGHKGRWNIASRAVAKRATGLVVITEGVKQFYVEKGLPAEKITVAPDGVDMDAFKNMKEQSAARTALDLPQHKYLAVYTGHLYSWKGVDVLAEAATYLPAGFEIVVAGGTDSDIEAFRRRYSERSNIRIVGRRPHHEIPDWLAAADMLMVPNTARDDISKHYTSPLKLFEYMAAERPIIASDLPSMREVLREDSAYLVRPDDPQAIADAMLAVRDERGAAAAKARVARADVAGYTWRKRAERIARFITDTIKVKN